MRIKLDLAEQILRTERQLKLLEKLCANEIAIEIAVNVVLVESNHAGFS